MDLLRGTLQHQARCGLMATTRATLVLQLLPGIYCMAIGLKRAMAFILGKAAGSPVLVLDYFIRAKESPTP
jgi:hypothetical protein